MDYIMIVPDILKSICEYLNDKPHGVLVPNLSLYISNKYPYVSRQMIANHLTMLILEKRLAIFPSFDHDISCKLISRIIPIKLDDLSKSSNDSNPINPRPLPPSNNPLLVA